MGANLETNLAAGKPKSTGGILVAPIGTALPTDNTTALNVAFKALGYVGEDGIQPGGERSLEEKKDWSGNVIANLQSGHSSVFSFTLLAALDTDVNKLIYGTANVTITAATVSTGTKMTIVENGLELPNQSFAFEMAYKKSKQRIILPNAQVGSVEESPWVAGDLQGYTVTLNAYADGSGNKVYRYLDDGIFA